MSTIKMIRDEGLYPAPHSANVHLDEVKNWEKQGWERQKAAKKPETDKPNPEVPKPKKRGRPPKAK